MKNLFGWALGAFFFAGDLTAELLRSEALNYVFKPALMLWLLAFYLLNQPKPKWEKSLVAAILFSWFGDIFLMFEAKHELFFMAGLGSFLLAHISYAFNFYQKNASFNLGQWSLSVGLLTYGAMMLFFLWTALPTDLKIPVALYVAVILMMVLTGLTRMGKVAPNSFGLVLVGALLFVLSDSLIALSKFLVEIPYSGFWIMATYVPAQFLIVKGKIMES